LSGGFKKIIILTLLRALGFQQQDTDNVEGEGGVIYSNNSDSLVLSATSEFVSNLSTFSSFHAPKPEFGQSSSFGTAAGSGPRRRERFIDQDVKEEDEDDDDADDVKRDIKMEAGSDDGVTGGWGDVKMNGYDGEDSDGEDGKTKVKKEEDVDDDGTMLVSYAFPFSLCDLLIPPPDPLKKIKQNTQTGGGIEEEPLIAGGMAATLALLKQKGFIEKVDAATWLSYYLLNKKAFFGAKLAA
jgi:hypothetical protein